MIIVDIVSADNRIDFSVVQLNSKPAKSVCDIRSSQVSRAIQVKLVEDSLENFLGSKLVDRESKCNELLVVNESIFISITISENACELSICHVRMNLSNGFFHLSNRNGAGSVDIKLLEFLFQFFKLFRAKHFHHDLHAFLAKFALTRMELSVSDDIRAGCCLRSYISTILSVEPGMSEALFC